MGGYTIVLFTILVLLFSCTIGTSHKIIVNQYGNDGDTLYKKRDGHYNMLIIKYNNDTINGKEKSR